ncbi:RNA polymerase III RPC4-domain-containing protein [Chlamydoabsidia padenii]|nr:RNA polymerase III RPC4-domain-containing protein [Chlamydoabsidia padenii]
MVVEEVTASGIFSLGPSAMSSRARSGMAGSGGAFATYGGDNSRIEKDDGAETDMSVLFAEANDGYTPVVFPHVPRLAGELDPADLTNPKEKIPWLTINTPPAKVDKEDTDVEMTQVKSEDGNDSDSDDQPKDAIKMDDDNDDDQVLPPRESWMMDDDAPAQNIFAVNEKNKVVSVADDELLFFQLPAVVPKFEKPTTQEDEGDEIKMEVKDENDKTKVKEQLPLAAQMSTIDDQMAAMDLSKIPEGQIGKLVVLKSGKMKLKIGNVLLDVEQGMRSSFLENVMSVDAEKKQAVELGHIVQKFTCVPNMNALLEDEEGK